MIYGVKCKSVSECGSSTFIGFEDEAGREIRIQQSAKLPVNFRFGAHYVIEINEITEVETIDAPVRRLEVCD